VEFKRDIYQELLEWKTSANHHALEVRGARQIGKTFIVDKFCKDNFKNVYKLDLGNPETYNTLLVLFGEAFFNPSLGAISNAGTPLEMFQRIFPDFVDNVNNILFFDEIQDSAFLYNMIRPINRQLKCRLIVSGSFLGHTINKEFFQPTGDLHTIIMRSMSFPEVLSAMGWRDMYETASLYGDSEPKIYEQLNFALEFYLRFGGHPKVVEYALNKNMKFADAELEFIVERFCKESQTYNKAISDNVRMKDYLIGVATLMLMGSEKSKPFKRDLGTIVGETNRQSVNNALSWFWESGIIEPCHRFNDGKKHDITRDCRFYFTDPGIAQYISRRTGVHPSAISGHMHESFAYGCIRDMRIPSYECPHFSSFGAGELDFMFFIHSSGKTHGVGIEVKAGKSTGKTIQGMFNKKILSYMIYAKGDTKGGRAEKSFTIPLPLLGRFNIFDYVTNDIANDDADMLEKIQQAGFPSEQVVS